MICNMPVSCTPQLVIISCVFFANEMAEDRILSDGTIYTKGGLRAAGCFAFFGKNVLCDFILFYFIFSFAKRSPETRLNLFLVGNLYVVDARV